MNEDEITLASPDGVKVDDFKRLTFDVPREEFLDQIDYIIECEQFDMLPRIPERKPVLDEEEEEAEFPDLRNEITSHEIKYREVGRELNQNALVMRQWGKLLQVLRITAREDAELARLLAGYADRGVSQSLTAELIEDIYQRVDDPNNQQRYSRSLLAKLREYGFRGESQRELTDGSLARFVHLPEVPEELLKPDIRSAYQPHTSQSRFVAERVARCRELRGLVDSTPRSENRKIEILGGYLDVIKNELRYLYEKTHDDLSKLGLPEGVSRLEKVVTYARYRMAREAKILCLDSLLFLNDAPHIELSDTFPNAAVIGTLRSPVFIQGDPEMPGKQARQLLNPDNWRSMGVLKDRVYVAEVLIDGEKRKYVIKQRKTDRHADTKYFFISPKAGGHRDGLTSEQEFKTAHSFRMKVYEGDGVRVSWEKPVGYAMFPDGFQFAVFDYEDGVLGTEAAVDTVMQHVINHREAYGDDYVRTRSEVIRKLEGMGRNKEMMEVSYEGFARTAATQAISRA